MTLDNPAVKTSPDLRDAPSFSIISKEISVGPMGEDGRRRFHLTASSTIEDMAGDEIEVAALHKAAEQFREGKTIFLDHDFKHVESAFGLTDTANVVQKGVDPATGKPVWDLDIYGVVNTPNPRAAQLADSIDGGYVKFGASLTAFIRKHQRKRNGAMLIKDIDVVEASVVGVAENQRSWAHKAAVAVKSFHKPEWLEDEEMLMSKDAETETAAPEPEAPETEADEATEEEHETTEETAEETPEEPVEKAASMDSADTCPECGKTRGADGCDNGFHSVEKSIDESTLGVQESVAADAVETPETAPDVADDVATAPFVEKAADVVTSAEAKELLGYVTAAYTEIGRLREENAILISKIATLEAGNGSLANEVEDATKVIQKVLGMPLRSQTTGYVAELSVQHPDIFAPEVQDFLNKRSKIRS